jgi:hypothetical protein
MQIHAMLALFSVYYCNYLCSSFSGSSIKEQLLPEEILKTDHRVS